MSVRTAERSRSFHQNRADPVFLRRAFQIGVGSFSFLSFGIEKQKESVRRSTAAQVKDGASREGVLRRDEPGDHGAHFIDL
jgi:hypothetical protein